MPKPSSPQHWLVKSEPDVFSIHDLATAKGRTTRWEGVRNYQARNFLRSMRKGDLALFYHSNAEPSAVAGIVEIVREAYPDPTAWDPASDYLDPKASPNNPIWSMVDVRLVAIFPREVPLDELRGIAVLTGMELLRRGSRLSVQPVTPAEFRTIERLAGTAGGPGRRSPRPVKPTKRPVKRPTKRPTKKPSRNKP
jgi:predicted RNA-binding protein with PUA-like domain